MRAGGQRGFSLLEAIVAMTVFASVAVVLYSWQAQAIRSLQRVADRQAFVAAVEAAMPVVDMINPMVTPRGERRIADLEVRWRSTALDGPKPGRTQVGAESLFDVGLYRVDVEVLRDGVEVARFNLRRPGYRQVRTVEEP